MPSDSRGKRPKFLCSSDFFSPALDETEQLHYFHFHYFDEGSRNCSPENSQQNANQSDDDGKVNSSFVDASGCLVMVLC